MSVALSVRSNGLFKAADLLFRSGFFERERTFAEGHPVTHLSDTNRVLFCCVLGLLDRHTVLHHGVSLPELTTRLQKVCHLEEKNAPVSEMNTNYKNSTKSILFLKQIS